MTESYCYLETLKGEDSIRYNQLILTLGTKCCPFKIPKNEWKYDPKEWPKVEMADIHNYIFFKDGERFHALIICLWVSLCMLIPRAFTCFRGVFPLQNIVKILFFFIKLLEN